MGLSLLEGRENMKPRSLALTLAIALAASNLVADSGEERAEKERCINLSAVVDDTATSSGVHLKVTAANHCSKDFSGTDTWFEVKAISRKNGGTSGKEVGHFQSTIPANGSAETFVDVACNPEERYDFKLRFWP